MFPVISIQRAPRCVFACDTLTACKQGTSAMLICYLECRGPYPLYVAVNYFALFHSFILSQRYSPSMQWTDSDVMVLHQKSDDKGEAIRKLEAVDNQGVAQAPRSTRLRRWKVLPPSIFCCPLTIPLLRIDPKVCKL